MPVSDHAVSEPVSATQTANHRDPFDRFQQYPFGKSVLVTGGSGYFGRGFVRAALGSHVQRVCVYSRDEAKHAHMREEINDPRVRYFVGDVRDFDRLDWAMESCDVVVHAAALKRVEVGEYDAEEMVKTNVVGAMNVIQAARKRPASGTLEQRCVVALSTDKAFEPVNAYGASKLLAEKLFLAANNARGVHGPRFAVTRYGNVAGSTGSVIPVWRAAMAAGRQVRISNGSATRFWMTLDEAVDLVGRTIATMRGGELVTPDLPAYELRDLATAMGVYKGSWITGDGLGPGEKLHEGMEPGRTSDQARRMSVDELREALSHV